jgi:hypothetical protein
MRIEEVMTNKTKRPKKKRDSLPRHFASIEEAADFWDTHGSADYEEYFVDVECEFDIRKRTHLKAESHSETDKAR